jgi:hypothetical protein
VTTVHEIDSTEQVRALSEHRAPRRYLCTVPVQVFAVPPAPPAAFVLPVALMTPPPATRTHVASGVAINLAMDLFQRSDPGEFTANDCTEFLLKAGWRNRNPLVCVVQKLRRLYFSGEVEEVSRAGREIVWRFK